jgi:hypothetical protein
MKKILYIEKRDRSLSRNGVKHLEIITPSIKIRLIN